MSDEPKKKKKKKRKKTYLNGFFSRHAFGHQHTTKLSKCHSLLQKMLFYEVSKKHKKAITKKRISTKKETGPLLQNKGLLYNKQQTYSVLVSFNLRMVTNARIQQIHILL